MQSSPYNNPMFAQGLAGLIQGFIGNPDATAKNEVLASEALLNNQTAQYREAIGDTGLNGDLASMMIRALQAGPGYSGNAPKIGDAAIRMGAMGYGSPALTPSGPIAGMIMQAMAGGGRGRGGGGRSGGVAAPVAAGGRGYDWNNLTATGRNAALSALRRAANAGQIPAGMTEAQAAALLAQNPGGWANEQEALLALTNPENFERGMVEVVTNPPGTMLSRLFGLAGDVPDATEMQPVGDWRFKNPSAVSSVDGAASGLETAQILNQAREALSAGKDPNAVKARLIEMGIDPANL